MVFDGVGDGLRQCDGEVKMASTARGQEGGTQRSNPKTIRHDERTIGRPDERTARDNVTTSWCNKTLRGWHDKTTRQQEGSASRLDATTTTSLHHEGTRGWRNKRMKRGHATTS